VPAETRTDAGELLEEAMKRSRGWTLILFEGQEEDNEDLEKHVRDVEIMDVDELRHFGESMKAKPDASGYINGIDEVVVFAADGPGDGHATFGVKGQCMYLVRPDMHVGLRSEPIREGAVLRYFLNSCGIEGQPGAHSCPAPSGTIDWVPTVVWGLIFIAFLAGFLFLSEEHPHKQTLKVCLGFVGLVVFLLTMCQCVGAKSAASAVPDEEDDEDEDDDDDEDEEEDEEAFPGSKQGLLSTKQ